MEHWVPWQICRLVHWGKEQGKSYVYSNEYHPLPFVIWKGGEKILLHAGDSAWSNFIDFSNSWLFHSNNDSHQKFQRDFPYLLFYSYSGIMVSWLRSSLFLSHSLSLSFSSSLLLPPKLFWFFPSCTLK